MPVIPHVLIQSFYFYTHEVAKRELLASASHTMCTVAHKVAKCELLASARHTTCTDAHMK